MKQKLEFVIVQESAQRYFTTRRLIMLIRPRFHRSSHRGFAVYKLLMGKGCCARCVCVCVLSNDAAHGRLRTTLYFAPCLRPRRGTWFMVSRTECQDAGFELD